MAKKNVRKYQFKPGDVIGSLTVLEDNNERNGRGIFVVRCRCSCGVEVIRQAPDLTGKRNNCCKGCRYLLAAKSNKERLQQIRIGDQFNDWTVIELPTDLSRQSNYHKYKVQCKCGTQKLCNRLSLTGGAAKRCKKCEVSNRFGERPFEIGEQVGNFKVLDIIFYFRDGRRCRKYKCLCKCGNISTKEGSALKLFRDAGCKKCHQFKKCHICGCLGARHKFIDIETSECEHLGFCEICDKFDINKHIDFSKFRRLKRYSLHSNSKV